MGRRLATAPAMLSPAMWDRFVWPYLKRLILEVTDHGLIPLLHLDGCWDRELHRFLELPARKMIVSLDGATDIFRAREILAGHSCLMGDAPPALLYAGSPKRFSTTAPTWSNSWGRAGSSSTPAAISRRTRPWRMFRP